MFGFGKKKRYVVYAGASFTENGEEYVYRKPHEVEAESEADAERKVEDIVERELSGKSNVKLDPFKTYEL